MRRIIALSGLLAIAASPLLAGTGSLKGSYVEARTAEVFTGGCIMGSEAETTGKQAVLAWKVSKGSFNGVSLDGLTIVAALSGDRNLGIQELGGAKASVRSTVYVDERANARQQMALVAMANQLSNGLMGTIVNVAPASVEFTDNSQEVKVSAGSASLAVSKQLEHDPTCGAMQWFHPLSSVDNASIGMANEHAFKGTGIGTRWSDPNKKSAFFGTFSY